MLGDALKQVLAYGLTFIDKQWNWPSNLGLAISIYLKQSSGTCIELGGFTKQVRAEAQLYQLSTADALQLIQSAQAIQNALGCKS